MGIRVRATRKGWYDNRYREPGDVFDIAEERFFSRRWMERVEELSAGELRGETSDTVEPIVATGDRQVI